MTQFPAIDKEQAVQRIEALPVRMLTEDEAYYALYGQWRRGSRLRAVWQWLFIEVLDRFWAAVRYEIPDRFLRLFGRSIFPQADGISLEEANELGAQDAKVGEMLFETAGIEMFLRRCRRTGHVPALGVDIPHFDCGEGPRFSRGDLVGFVRCQTPIEYEAGSLNLFHSHDLEPPVPAE